MAIEKAYIETTMFNYFFDTHKGDQCEATKAFFEAVGRGEVDGYTSPYAVAEIEDCPEPKRSDMMSLIEDYGIKRLSRSDEIEQLAQIYLDQKDGIPGNKRDDALHVACATMNNIRYVISWNCHHISKDKTRAMVNRVNKEQGYEIVAIGTPHDLMEVFNDTDSH
jgi:predicted nucleic acid-binding protein